MREIEEHAKKLAKIYGEPCNVYDIFYGRHHQQSICDGNCSKGAFACWEQFLVKKSKTRSKNNDKRRTTK